jgi:hypothetical protein
MTQRAKKESEKANKYHEVYDLILFVGGADPSRQYTHRPDHEQEKQGNTDAYAEYEEKTAGYDDPQWKLLSGEGAKILAEFGSRRDLDPAGAEAQELVKKWQQFMIML